jgi:Cd2+/Zn2+-exporting ATPase
LKAPHHAETNEDRLQLDIPVLLPSLPDEADACVGRLVGELEGRDGIDRVHVLPASGDQPAKLCIDYRPEVLSLGRIKEIAEGAGAQLTKRFGHILLEAGGLSNERRARTVTEHLQRVTGVMEAMVTVAGAAGPKWEIG